MVFYMLLQFWAIGWESLTGAQWLQELLCVGKRDPAFLLLVIPCGLLLLARYLMETAMMLWKLRLRWHSWGTKLMGWLS